jgi:hypothetical protein
MSMARNFGPVAEEMAQALEQYSKEELRDLLTHIVKTYVVEGTLPLKPEVGTVSGDERLAKLTFPQLVLHLQMRLDHREWSLFSVSGEDVWVTSGGQRINLTGRPSPMPQASAVAPDQGAQPSAPLPPLPEPPIPAAPPMPVAEPTAPARTSAPDPLALEGEDARNAARADRDPFEPDVEASERFGMLEID